MHHKTKKLLKKWTKIEEKFGNNNRNIKQLFYYWYVEKNMRTGEIAKMLNVNRKNLSYWLVKNGINLVNKGNKKPQFTKQDILKYLVGVSKKLGRAPTWRELRSNDGVSTPGPHQVKLHFNSFNEAISAAGLETFYERKKRENCSKTYPKKHRGSVKLRWKILERDKFKCQYCGRSVKDGIILEVDHKIPQSKGGKTIMSNLITSCQKCNAGKSDSLLDILLNKDS